MSESPSPKPAGHEVLPAAWDFVRDPARPARRPSRVVHVGDVAVGGTNPIRLQSMTVADTLDTPAVVQEICALHEAGSEIVRVTAPNRSSAENLAVIKQELARRRVRVPLVADIHFTPQAALIAALHVEKVRINPGNYADRKHFVQREYTESEYAAELERLEAAFRPLVLRCKERGIAMRIGTNHGSLSDRILNRYGDTPLGMVESALEFVRICELHGYRELLLSMKASDVKVMMQAYRLLALRMHALGMDYPFHLGVTEAGAGLAARVKSAVGIGALLADGLGDTIRVSLTEDSVHELPVARALAAFAVPASQVESASRESALPPWNPLQFERAPVRALGRGSAVLAADRPPRVELLLPLASLCAGAPWSLPKATADATLERDTPPDLILLQPNETDPHAGWTSVQAAATLVAAARATPPPAFGLEVPLGWLAGAPRAALQGWARLSLLVGEAAELHRLPPPGPGLPPLQYTLPVDPADGEAVERAARDLASAWERSAWPPGAVALQTPVRKGVARALVPAWRRFLAAWPDRPLPPAVLRGHGGKPAPEGQASAEDLELAVTLGGLLADGVGNAVQLQVTDAAAAARHAARLAAELLQATRLRLSRADFIACPSCGRTQFELQSTTARIEARLRHLEGLKIAVMGCIVNGPGEMADADFGYVGSGAGRIDLYVGRERVLRNVPQEEAVERLVELIRSHGRWVEPGAVRTTQRGELE